MTLFDAQPLPEQLLLAEQLLLGCIYCVLVSGLLYCGVTVLSRFSERLARWRGLWLMLLTCGLLPVVYGFIPLSLSSLSPVVILDNLGHITLIPPSEGLKITETQHHSLLTYAQIVVGCGLLLLLISMLMLVKNILQWLAVKRLIQQAIPVDDYLNQVTHTTEYHRRCLGKLQRLLTINKHPSKNNRTKKLLPLIIKVSHKAPSPFVTGLLKPTLILTPESFSALSATQFNLMLRHELTHLKRHDPTVLMLAQCLKSIFWFNPFIKHFVLQLNWAIELSCDALVLQRRSNLRRIYALAMLTILRRSATQPFDKSVAAFSSTPQRSFTMRIKLIMNPNDNGIKRSIKNLGLIGASMGIISSSFAFQPTLSPSTDDGAIKSTIMLNPVATARVSSNFGANNKVHKFHKGIDLADKRGAPVVASASGTVVISTDLLQGKKNYGKIIVVDHGNGLQSLYSHLDQRNVAEGERVKAGQQIGQVGATGKTTGPHLHFELRKDNQPINPNDYIAFP